MQSEQEKFILLKRGENIINKDQIQMFTDVIKNLESLPTSDEHMIHEVDTNVNSSNILRMMSGVILGALFVICLNFLGII